MLKLICGFRGDKKLEVNDYWIVDPTEDKKYYAIMSDKGVLGRFKDYENAKKTFRDMICEENLQMNNKHRECKIRYNEIENGKEYVIVNNGVFKARIINFIRNKDDMDNVIGVKVLKDGNIEDIFFKDNPKFNTTYWSVKEGAKVYELLDNSVEMFFDLLENTEDL